MKLQQPWVYSDFSSGLIDSLSVGKGLLPQNSCTTAINVVFHKPKGSIAQRYGSTLLGTQIAASQTVYGLHDFRPSDSNNNKLLAAVNGSIYSSTGGAFTSRQSITGSLKTRFLTYLNTAVYMNGTDSSRSSTDGINWSSGGGNLDVGNFPKAKFATILNGRVLVGGDPSAPDTVNLSSVVSSNAVSWTSGNKTVQVSPNDGGGSLTGVTSNGRLALLFKERGLYRYDDTSLQRVGKVGTPSHESIVEDDNGIVYFFGQGANGVGFYKTMGGFPMKISRQITKVIDAISPSFYASVAGYTDGSLIEWPVGSITLDDVTYTNASVVYSVSDQVWSVFDRAQRFLVFSQYITSTSAVTTVGGDTSGNVQTINSGNTDNGTPIYGHVEMAPIVFTTRGREKSVQELYAYAETFNGLSAAFKVDGKLAILGSITDKTHTFDKIPLLKGREFVPVLTSVNSGEPFLFTGWEFPSDAVIDGGNVK